MPQKEPIWTEVVERNNIPIPEGERTGRYEDGFRVLQGQREYVTYQDDSSFRLWYSDIPWRYDAHRHSAIEIVLPLTGWVDYDIEGIKYRVQKDEVLIVPSETFHGLNMEKGSSRLLFLFEPQPLEGMRDIKVIADGFHQAFYLHDGGETHTRIRELLMKAAELYREHDSMWNTLCFSCILQIYAILGQEYLTHRKPQEQPKEVVVETQVISAAMNYINENYQRDLSLDEVASFAGFSRYYFSRSFKIQTGYTFRDYLSGKRVQAAMELLIHTRKSMRDIAEESGFGSVATFNRVFRDAKGCTPTQYRAIYGEYAPIPSQRRNLP